MYEIPLIGLGAYLVGIWLARIFLRSEAEWAMKATWVVAGFGVLMNAAYFADVLGLWNVVNKYLMLVLGLVVIAVGAFFLPFFFAGLTLRSAEGEAEDGDDARPRKGRAGDPRRDNDFGGLDRGPRNDRW